MPARPPNGFLHHLPRTLNKITEMKMLPHGSNISDWKSKIIFDCFHIDKIKFLLYYSLHDDTSEESFGHIKLN